MNVTPPNIDSHNVSFFYTQNVNDFYSLELIKFIHTFINFYVHHCFLNPTAFFLLGSSAGKESACNTRHWFNCWVGKPPWRRDRLPTPVSLGFPGSSDCKESVCSAGDLGSILGWEDPLEGQRTPVFLPGKSPWQSTVHGWTANSWT